MLHIVLHTQYIQVHRLYILHTLYTLTEVINPRRGHI